MRDCCIYCDMGAEDLCRCIGEADAQPRLPDEPSKPGQGPPNGWKWTLMEAPPKPVQPGIFDAEAA